MKAFLDMDGVIADFVKAALALHGQPDLYERVESIGVFDCAKLLGITEKEFWAPLGGKTFWHDLPKTPEADKIVEFVERQFGQDNVAILTAPSMSKYCITGKQEWINRHYPQFSKRIIFAGASTKHFVASAKAVLFDDRDENVSSFKASGGHAVLVPRPWNKAAGEPVMKYLEDKLWWKQ